MAALNETKNGRENEICPPEGIPRESKRVDEEREKAMVRNANRGDLHVVLHSDDYAPPGAGGRS